jgi:hypothetical protein
MQHVALMRTVCGYLPNTRVPPAGIAGSHPTSEGEGGVSSWYDQIRKVIGSYSYSYRSIYLHVLQPKQSNPDGGTQHATN